MVIKKAMNSFMMLPSFKAYFANSTAIDKKKIPNPICINPPYIPNAKKLSQMPGVRFFFDPSVEMSHFLGLVNIVISRTIMIHPMLMRMASSGMSTARFAPMMAPMMMGGAMK